MRTLALTISLACLGAVGCESPPPTPDAGTDATPRCAGDDDCDDGLYCTGVEVCVEGACTTTRVPCRDGQLCAESIMRCYTECSVAEDADGDGARAVECGGADCDDADPERFPGNAEICDVGARDEDCDPGTYGFRDADMDGSPDDRCCNADAEGGRSCGHDCDDAAPGRHPAVPEVCNAIDDDCDGATDEGLLRVLWVDADGDEHGDPESTPREACDDEPGWSELDDDCDDADEMRFPGNPELCDDAMLDEDCSGAGNDVPGGCECTGSGSEVCGTMGRCAGATRTCMSGTWGPCAVVPATETCNDEDDDCDGMVDETLRVTCYTDGDGDGFTAAGAAPMQTCRSSSPGRAAAPWNGCPLMMTGRAPGPAAVDCCDADGRARPNQTTAQGTASACGGFDFDCDGTTEPGNVDFTRTATCRASSSESTCRDQLGGWDPMQASIPTRCGQSGVLHDYCWWIGGCYSGWTMTQTYTCL